MMCGTNYLWIDAKQRSTLGMMGGAGLGSTYTPDGSVAFAGWDESTAFTSVIMPEWAWPWCACPPVRARDVWSQLPQQLRARVSSMSFVYPMYTQLVMGGSHSVHLLMSINVHSVGKTLVRCCRLGQPPSASKLQATQYFSLCEGDEDELESSEDEEGPPLAVDDDDRWAEVHSRKRVFRVEADTAQAGIRTLEEFSTAVKVVKMASERVFVVVHVFVPVRDAKETSSGI